MEAAAAEARRRFRSDGGLRGSRSPAKPPQASRAGCHVSLCLRECGHPGQRTAAPAATADPTGPASEVCSWERAGCRFPRCQAAGKRRKAACGSCQGLPIPAVAGSGPGSGRTAESSAGAAAAAGGLCCGRRRRANGRARRPPRPGPAADWTREWRSAEGRCETIFPAGYLTGEATSHAAKMHTSYKRGVYFLQMVFTCKVIVHVQYIHQKMPVHVFFIIADEYLDDAVKMLRAHHSSEALPAAHNSTNDLTDGQVPAAPAEVPHSNSAHARSPASMFGQPELEVVPAANHCLLTYLHY